LGILGEEGLLEAVKKKGRIFVSPLCYFTEFVKIYICWTPCPCPVGGIRSLCLSCDDLELRVGSPS
jgi:hypothetical protein